MPAILLNALMELLAAAPSLIGDVQAGIASWHNAHGNPEKTAAAASMATQIIAGAAAVATSVETAAAKPATLTVSGAAS